MAVHAQRRLRLRRPRVDYRRILVPVIGEESEKAVTIACRLAAERHASVTAITVVEVPSELPLDAHMLGEEARARQLLAEAASIADLYGVDVHPRIVRARGAGEAIVEEASAMGAEIVVLRAPRTKRRRGRAPGLGRTVEYVLAHATVRVMIAASAGDG